MPPTEQTGKMHRFGDPRHVLAERGMAEIRAARPIRISDATTSWIAIPVDGLDQSRLATFLASCAPVKPRLVITARRARAIGIDTARPVSLEIADPSVEPLLAMACEMTSPFLGDAVPAAPAFDAMLDLAKLAQRLPAFLAVDASATAAEFDPPLVDIATDAVADFREMTTRSLKIVGQAQVPLEGGVRSRFVVFRNAVGNDSVAVVVGEPDFSKPVPVRLHSACLTGDVFGSRRCDCGDQLRLALGELAGTGGGVILYLDQEGRGVGLANKMRAYQLQDAGFDTVDANISLGFDDDERDYQMAGRMLDMLGCRRVQLFTNNPGKITGLAGAGIDISERIPLFGPINGDNRRYLTAKATRNGHAFGHLLEALTTNSDQARLMPAENTFGDPPADR